VKPFADSPREYQADWRDIVARTHPQDGQPYKDAGMNWIGTTLGAPGADANANVLYTLFYASDSNPSDAVMKQRLGKAVKGTTVREH
jgi:hypothetical protein